MNHLLETDELQSRLGDEGVAVVDLSHPYHHENHRVPGAMHVAYRDIVEARPPVDGLVALDDHLASRFAAAGLAPEQKVIAYDDEGGAKAARFLWTLDLLGHRRWALLNGGLIAWLAEGRPVEAGPSRARSGNYPIEHRRDDVTASRQHVLQRLGHPDVVLVDARTLAEFRGLDLRANRGGHIPGAVNVDWTLNVDPEHQVRMRPPGLLRSMFERFGVTPDKEIIVYCQTHFRSAHTYVALKTLGYPRVRGYPGAWSEWGNDSGLPIE